MIGDAPVFVSITVAPCDNTTVAVASVGNVGAVVRQNTLIGSDARLVSVASTVVVVLGVIVNDCAPTGDVS